jgi:putative oxidoreductase
MPLPHRRGHRLTLEPAVRPAAYEPGIRLRPREKPKCSPLPDGRSAKWRDRQISGRNRRSDLKETDMSTTFHQPRPAVPPPPVAWLSRLAAVLAAHSITALRMSLGLIITAFGVLKFFPGASPAAGLAATTTEALTFGIVSGTTAVVAVAVVETFIGLTLLTGVGLRAGLVVMVGWLGGIMAPVILFPGQMFPEGLPTLTAQYVLKDVILVAAAAVIGAHVLGARYRIKDPGR